MKKLFLSHASEDKETFVRPLVAALSEKFTVWYDEYSLVPGMSLLESINKGLREADYGLVVFSPAFFAKKWTQGELAGLYSLEERTRTIIIPIWKDITAEDMKVNYPMLADRVAIKQIDSLPAVVESVKNAIDYFELGKTVVPSQPGVTLLTQALIDSVRTDENRAIIDSEKGVKFAVQLAADTCTCAERLIKEIQVESGDRSLSFIPGKCTQQEYSCRINCKNYSLFFHYFNTVTNSAIRPPMEVQIFKDDSIRSFDGNYKKIRGEKYELNFNLERAPAWKSSDGKLWSPENLVAHWYGVLATLLKEIPKQLIR